jgi:ApeA N-terminal domain 1
LLTGSDYSLEWPLVCFQNNSKCRWYFRRLRSNEPLKDIDYHNTITNFVELRDQFGSIWSKWVAKRAELCPGIYLYLGTRRGMPLYEEHRFVNLIWGVEAFHREKTRLWRSDALKEKIDRIVGQVALETDKKWLRERLKHAHEPPLEQRIFEVFKTLPIGLDEGRLRAFSKACAKLRNDISHFGGDRHRESYLEFIRDLDRKSDALSILYHALLLHEVEIDATILSRWINDSFGSYAIKMHFAQAGLLDQNMLGDNPL